MIISRLIKIDIALKLKYLLDRTVFIKGSDWVYIECIIILKFNASIDTYNDNVIYYILSYFNVLFIFKCAKFVIKVWIGCEGCW